MSLMRVHKESDAMTEGPKILIRPNPHGDWPQVDSAAYVDPTAQIIGNVRIGPHVFVGPNAVIRADEIDENGQVQPVDIGAQCNVQDGVIIHALGGTQVTVGRRTSLSHGCIIHGPCKIGSDCFVGFRAVVFNTKLRDGVFIGTSAVVQGVDLTPNAYVPPAAAVLSEEDVKKRVGITTSSNREFIKKIITANLILTKGYLRAVRQE